jgi:phosphoglycolate phosphatase
VTAHPGLAGARVPVAVIAAAARERRHVLFDLDGTLVDSNAACIAILQDMLAERGSTRRIDPASGRRLMSYGGIRMVTGLLAEECGDAGAELAEFRARYLVWTTGAETLYDGVLPGVQHLTRAGFTLAVCSNKPQALCEKVLADTGLDTFITATVGSVPGRAPKPAPDALDAVLGLLARDAAECIFVGDSELDYRVARDADMPFAFMTYGYAEPDWHPAAAHDWHDAAGENFDHFDHLVAALLANAPAWA